MFTGILGLPLTQFFMRTFRHYLANILDQFTSLSIKLAGL